MENLHERIRELRKAERLSQAELGERVGIGRVGITKLEQGQRPVSVEEARALADALGVSLMYLLEGEESDEQAEEEGVELRFEVTVKLLPSREEKALDPFFAYIGKHPELQQMYDEAIADDPAKAERIRAKWLEANARRNEIISKGAEKQGRTRPTGKDQVPSKRRVKS